MSSSAPKKVTSPAKSARVSGKQASFSSTPGQRKTILRAAKSRKK